MTPLQCFWAVVTWLTVIVGWMVVADQQSSRELRKDRSSRLNDIRDRLEDAEKTAVAFHTATQFSPADAFALRRLLGSIARELTVLTHCGFVSSDCTEAMVSLRQACTETNQEKNTFQQVAYFSEQTGAIMAAREALDDLLSKALTEALLSNKPISHSLRDLGRRTWTWTGNSAGACVRAVRTRWNGGD